MIDIKELKKVIRELSKNNDLPAESKKPLIAMANNIIRSEEIVKRFSDYFENGYHFGYYLIQSQRIENTVKMIIEAAERLKATIEKRPIQQIDLNIPLGPLIGVMGKYVKAEKVSESLVDFNKFRRQIIHRFYEDFSQSLEEIEGSVAKNFPPTKINHLQTSLLEIGSQINLKIAKYMDDSMVAKQIAKQLEDKLQSEIELSDVKFELI